MARDGFDAVEVVMNTEDTFGISIPEKEAESLKTVGELHAYVCRRVSARADGSCQCAGAAAFYRGRRIIGAALGIHTNAIRPSTDVSEFLGVSAEDRRAEWRRLCGALGVRIPELRRPAFLERLIWLVGWSLLISASVVGSLLCSRRTIQSDWPWICLGLWVALLLGEVVLVLATRRFAVEVPKLFSTAGALSSLLMGPEMDRLDRRRAGWHEHEVWEMVRWWCAKSAGIPPVAINRQTTFSCLYAISSL